MKHLHDNLYVMGQITEQDLDKFADQGITTIINNRPDGEEPGQLDHLTARQLAAKQDIHYYYLPMVNGQALPSNLVEDFKSALELADGAVLAHCRSGMRSSFIWALGAIAAGEISPDQAIAAANQAGIPLQNARAVLESVRPQ